VDRGRLIGAAERFPEYVREPFRDMLTCPDGAAALFALVTECGGSNVYVPTMRNLFGGCLLMGLVEDCGNRNADEIARLCGYSVGHVRKFLRSRSGA